jgi:hypothetical protein
MRFYRRWWWSLGLLLLLTSEALAQIGQGSTRVPLTDWLIEFYNVTNNVYVPLLALIAIVGAAWAILGGHVRIGPTMGKMILVILLLGLGVAWILQQIGANAAIAVLG